MNESEIDLKNTGSIIKDLCLEKGITVQELEKKMWIREWKCQSLGSWL